MGNYTAMSREALEEELGQLQTQYEKIKGAGLKLDISRGKPEASQVALSMGMLDVLGSGSDLQAENGMDCGNYGGLEGIPEARRLMGELLEVPAGQVIVGGNSSLSLMHLCVGIGYLFGYPGGSGGWCKEETVKFLCPAPGYDRHFAITEHFGISMIPVSMTPDGPDMDEVEHLVKDSSVKGIWCVPKYQNPLGVTFSDEVVRRMAGLSPAAGDFRIFWDNAYAVHDIYPQEGDVLLPILAELEKAGKPDMALLFTSTSKLSFPGAGISAVGASPANIQYLLGHMGKQSISADKINQLRHVRYFQNLNNIKAHMKGHADLLRPKFEMVWKTLEEELGDTGIAQWTTPKGGYFISLDVMEGCAKETVSLCKEAGVVLTGAGATFPYGNDPRDQNIRIAPSFATLGEVEQATRLLCLSARLSAAKRLLKA